MENNVQVILSKHFTTNIQLLDEMMSIASESFIDASFLQKKHFKICDTAYLVYDNDKLVAYLICNWDDIYLKSTKGVWIGFAAVTLKHRQKNYFSSLLLFFNNEANEWCKSNNESLFLYGFTANPLTYNQFNSTFQNFYPAPDLSYSEDASRITNYLLEHKFHKEANEYPFLFKKNAKHFYTKPELTKIKRYTSELNILFRLGVEVENGDRLLFLCLFNFNKNSSFA